MENGLSCCYWLFAKTTQCHARERPLRYQRTTGLMVSQMQELVARVNGVLKEPWNKKVGRPKACGLY